MVKTHWKLWLDRERKSSLSLTARSSREEEEEEGRERREEWRWGWRALIGAVSRASLVSSATRPAPGEDCI